MKGLCEVVVADSKRAGFAASVSAPMRGCLQATLSAKMWFHGRMIIIMRIYSKNNIDAYASSNHINAWHVLALLYKTD